jgi:DNA damage-binding protein 1
MIAQVTAAGVRLVDCQSHHLLYEYQATRHVTVARGNLSQLVLSLSGGVLLYFAVNPATRQLELVAEKQLDQDVACISLQSSQPSQLAGSCMDVDSDVAAAPTEKETLVAVGMWTDNTIRLLALPSFEEIHRSFLATETQARDILLASYAADSCCYLFVGMGDGHLITYSLDMVTGSLPSLINKRNGVIGTQPIAFTPFYSHDELCIFASCDRPTIIYMRNGKMLFSLVDIQNTQQKINTMTPFHAELFPDCVSLCSESELMIGVIEDIQKMHVQTIALGEAPRRITHCQDQHALAVCTEQVIIGEHGEESISKVLFFEDSDMSLIGSYPLDVLEQGLSACTCRFEGSDSAYFIIGTAQVINDEPEPLKGRILVFEISSDRKMIQLVAARETKSGVYTLAAIGGKLAAGIGSKVQIYKFVTKDHALKTSFSVQPELQSECSHQGHIMVMFLKVHADFLVVGDLVRSITILQYKPTENILEENARDFNVHMMRAVEVMDGEEDYYLGCEDHGNMFVVRRQVEAVNEEERSKLEARCYFHIGDYVNVMRRGTLVTQPIQVDLTAAATGSSSAEKAITIFDTSYRYVTGLATDRHSVLYGTVSGAIGNILALSEPSYRFFMAVERAMRVAVAPVGDFTHQDWRSFQNEVKVCPQKNVLDGDLIEMLLDLAPIDQEVVVNEVNSILLSMPTTATIGDNTASISSESSSALIASLAADRRVFSVEEVLHRVEDISRLH